MMKEPDKERLTEQQVVAGMTLMQIQNTIETMPANGSYFIADVHVGDLTQKNLLLNWLMSTLSRQYPMYIWQRQEELFDSLGVTVIWTRR